MDSKANELATLIVHRLSKSPPLSRLIIGISGIPASGKSTLASLVVVYTNRLLREQSDGADHSQAILVGVDGWHLTRAQLDAFPDPKLAHARRGIHWSFDGEGYSSFVQALRRDVSEIITAPSFDHALKDPTPASISVYPFHRIVVIEGLYTFLSTDPWQIAGRLLDERWFLQVDSEKATERLVKRHVASGVAKDMDEAIWRARENDMPNGLFVIENMLEPTMIIQSVEDPMFSFTTL